MGKKKNKDKPKKQKDTTKIEERIKSIANIKLPDSNPYKNDNEEAVSKYFKFGRSLSGKKYKSIKEERRHKNN